MNEGIKISKKSEDTVDIISRLTGRSKQEVLDDAIDFFAREQFLNKANKEFEALSKNLKK